MRLFLPLKYPEPRLGQPPGLTAQHPVEDRSLASISLTAHCFPLILTVWLPASKSIFLILPYSPIPPPPLRSLSLSARLSCCTDQQWRKLSCSNYIALNPPHNSQVCMNRGSASLLDDFHSGLVSPTLKSR